MVVETPPDIDYDKFSQYFMNWIESMGWSFCGSLKKHEEESDGNDYICHTFNSGCDQIDICRKIREAGE